MFQRPEPPAELPVAPSAARPPRICRCTRHGRPGERASEAASTADISSQRSCARLGAPATARRRGCGPTVRPWFTRSGDKQDRLCPERSGCASGLQTVSGFGGKNPRITLEQGAEAVNGLASAIWKRHWRSSDEVAERCAYYQKRNAASYESRRRTAKRRQKR